MVLDPNDPVERALLDLRAGEPTPPVVLDDFRHAGLALAPDWETWDAPNGGFYFETKAS